MWHNARLLNASAALVAAFALVIYAWAALHWTIRRPAFELQSIVVEGDGRALVHLNGATVRANVLPHIRGNFFTVDLPAVRHAFENIDWVRQARVRREWPDRLVVRIEEHEAIALWNDDRLVNTFGEVFQANVAEAEGNADLPALAGPAGSEKEVVARFHDFVRWFAKLELTPDLVALSPRYAWTVRLDNGTDSGLMVELGRESDHTVIEERVQRMLAAYPIMSAKWPKLTLIDLRYPNGFALRAEGLRIGPVEPANTRVNRGSEKPSGLVHKAM